MCYSVKFISNMWFTYLLLYSDTKINLIVPEICSPYHSATWFNWHIMQCSSRDQHLNKTAVFPFVLYWVSKPIQRPRPTCSNIGLAAGLDFSTDMMIGAHTDWLSHCFPWGNFIPKWHVCTSDHYLIELSYI